MGFEMSRIIGEDGNRRYFVLFMFLFRAAETPKAIALPDMVGPIDVTAQLDDIRRDESNSPVAGAMPMNMLR